MKDNDTVINHMHTLYPDEGDDERRKENLMCRIGFYSCYTFLNGQYEADEKIRKEILQKIQEK